MTLKKFKKKLSKVLNHLKILWKMDHLLRGANAPFSMIFFKYDISKVSTGVIREQSV